MKIILIKETERNNLSQQCSDYWQIRSRARQIENGEKSTKYFFQRFKIRNNDFFSFHFCNYFNKSEKEALNTAIEFYQNLYKKEKTAEHSYFLDNLPHISIINNEKLVFPIIDKELKQIINNLPNRKASGPNGILYEFYKEKQKLLIPYLLKTFNNILLTASIPKLWKISSITLILKKSNDK